MADAVPVSLEETADGWQLLRDGEPYFIHGAGGTHSLEALAEAGANSVRTWDGENIDALLDEAHSLGLTVTVGIWLGHERHGFDYGDAAQVAEQKARVRRIVEQYKDHPAVLLWGLGNEMEGFDEGDNPAIWAAVNDVAAMVKEIDPLHPTMTVTAFIHGERIDYVHRKSPAIDIHGINAYGGAVVVPEQMAAGGATKPYILTEFGPPGTWEVATTAWGAAVEPTSAEKAAAYRRHYDAAIAAAPGKALGGYAFVWGHKVEATATWFGMWLKDGARTAAVDVMSELWSGEAPADPAPVASALTVEGGTQVDPGTRLAVSVSADDAGDGPLQARWALTCDTLDNFTGGDFRPEWPAIDEAIVDGDIDGALIRMPEAPGPYRLYYTVYDEAGGAATANLPLLVRGEARTPMPFPVYEDSLDGMGWVPSGWMGNTDKLHLDGDATDFVYSGDASIRIRLDGPFGWGGIAWQHPPNNWGEQEGGLDMSGATALEFWARGRYGGEKIGFGVGLLGPDVPHRDSAIVKKDGVVLTREWSRYRVPLKGRDLSSLKTGFYVTLTGRQSPVTIYLDQIRFVQ